MLTLNSCPLVLLGMLFVCGASASNNGSSNFGEATKFLNQAGTVEIYYLDIMDQRGMSLADLRQSAVARLVVDCGSSCRQNFSKLVQPIESAKKIDYCPRAEIMFIVDFDDKASLEFFRGANMFRYNGVCYESSSSGQVLRNIFDFI